MTVQTQDQSIQKFARGTKTTLQVTFAAVAVLMAGTAIYAAAKGVALSSTFLAYLANPWAIAIIVSVAAVYLIAAAYQQWHSIEGAPGKDGKPGKDADFSVFRKDAIIKDGTISVAESGEKGSETQEAHLKLSKADYDALTNDVAANTEVTLYVLLAGKSASVKFTHTASEDQERTVKLTDINGKTGAEMKPELDMVKEVNSLEVKVSKQDYQALKSHISTKFTDAVIGVVPAAKVAAK